MIETLTAFGGGALGYLIPFLFVLTIVVFFHELGHFAVARWCGVKVDAFSIGFGPEIFGFNDKKGTRWRLAAIPLGGYVKFHGDENAASAPDHDSLKTLTDEERSENYHLKPVGQRMAIVAAGPIANFILAIVIFAFMFSVVGKLVTTPRVDTVRENSAAAVAGFQAGDIVLSIDGREISSFSDLQRIVSSSADRELSIIVDRGGAELTLTATPLREEITDGFGNTHRVGILGISRNTESTDYDRVIYPPHEAVVAGVGETWFVIDRTLSFIGGLIMGRESPEQLGGPIRIAQVSGDVASVSFSALINLTAILSVSIGLLNLFPIPMLDGGHLVFYTIEAIRGRPLSERVLEMSFRAGLAIVLMLMLFATWNDLSNLNLL